MAGPQPGSLATPEEGGRPKIWLLSQSLSHVTLHSSKIQNGPFFWAWGSSALVGEAEQMVPALLGESLGQPRPLGRQAPGIVLLWESGDLLGEAREDPSEPPAARPCSGWGCCQGQGPVRLALGLHLCLLIPTVGPEGPMRAPHLPCPIANQQSRANGPKVVGAPGLWGALNKGPLCPQCQERGSDPWGG